MYLVIKYGRYAENNSGRIEVLDEALKETLKDFGFYLINNDFDIKKGESFLEFRTGDFFFDSNKDNSKQGGDKR